MFDGLTVRRLDIVGTEKVADRRTPACAAVFRFVLPSHLRYRGVNVPDIKPGNYMSPAGRRDERLRRYPTSALSLRGLGGKCRLPS